MDKRLFTVIKKELKRIFTDRRLVFTIIILPAVSIFLMYSLMGKMISTKVDDVKANVPTVIAINAPESFKTYIKNNVDEELFEFEYFMTEKDTMRDDIKNGKTEILLIFEKSFDSKVNEFTNPSLHRLYNDSEEYSSRAKWSLDTIFSEYEAYLLGVRIGNLDHVNVFDIEENGNIEDIKKATGKGLSNLFPMLIAIFLFAGAMSVGPDIIAGEKERGTMATLLVTPVKRETLAFGKIIALCIISIISALSSFIGIIASLPAAGAMFASDGVNIAQLQFSLNDYLSLGGIMLTLVGLYVVIICLISVISKSIKEANTYMAPVYMIVMMAGFSTMFLDGPMANWKFAIPVYGSIIAMKNLFTFELTGTMVLYTCGSSIVLIGILTYIIKLLFNNEKVMFSK